MVIADFASQSLIKSLKRMEHKINLEISVEKDYDRGLIVSATQTFKGKRYSVRHMLTAEEIKLLIDADRATFITELMSAKCALLIQEALNECIFEEE